MLHGRSVDERKINQGTRLTERSFEWKNRELIVHCVHADDDDNKKIYRLTSIEKTVENVRLLAIHIKSHENFEGLTNNRMLQKPNERSQRRRQPTRTTKSRKLIKARKCRSSTGSKPTMLTMWPRRRRLELTRPQQKEMRKRRSRAQG